MVGRAALSVWMSVVAKLRRLGTSARDIPAASVVVGLGLVVVFIAITAVIVMTVRGPVLYPAWVSG